MLMRTVPPEPIAQRAMKAALRGAPKPPTGADTWANLPLNFRLWLALDAIGMRAHALYEQAWTDIDFQDRAVLGRRLRELAGLLR